MNPSKRSTMEDAVRILPEFIPAAGGDAAGEEGRCAYFAVMDGHGGRGVVDYVDEHLHENLRTEMAAIDDAPMPERIARAYLATDVGSREADLVASGCTAVTALIQVESDAEGQYRMLYTANVGDSRAVLCEEGAARRLSYDHKAEDAKEQERIAQHGGFILRNRVLGILAVTRSFGDHGMKDFVTSNPHITITRLGPSSECPFLILACDGVWDVLTDEEAVGLVMNRYRERGNQPDDGAAAMLVHEAVDRGSADNISCIVIFL